SFLAAIDQVIPGDYELLQCDAKREWCYCADAKTGREAPNSRKGTGENKYIICGSTNNSIDPNELFYADAILQQRERYSVASPTCKLDKSKGVACQGQGAQPSVRYYFDYNTATCLAFEYLGCGGNANNYRTSSDCFSNCFFADQSGCAGMYPSARLSNGYSIICPRLMLPPGTKPATTIVGPKLNKEDCPLDHSCRMGAFFGTCCPQANEDRFDAAYNRKCSNGREPYSIPKDGWRRSPTWEDMQGQLLPYGIQMPGC
ncbi:Kunitz/Bovine pancreatic trypsin inhibitor domain protein, partial [Ostertagia ostertagi]